MKPEDYPAPGSLWRHYKGGVYVVEGFATDAATEEEVVIYYEQNTMDTYAGEPLRKRVMPLWMWHQPIGPSSVNGSNRRFAPVRSEGDGETNEQA